MSHIPLHKFEDPREFSREDRLNTPFEIAQIDHLSEMDKPAVPHRHTYYEIFWMLDRGRNSTLTIPLLYGFPRRKPDPLPAYVSKCKPNILAMPLGGW